MPSLHTTSHPKSNRTDDILTAFDASAKCSCKDEEPTLAPLHFGRVFRVGAVQQKEKYSVNLSYNERGKLSIPHTVAFQILDRFLLMQSVLFL